MGLFGQSTPFDADIEKATSDTNTNENWSLILDVCDKVSANPRSAKDCLKAIMKRMGHADPHVVMQAITLLDACANNCGKPFHLEIASRDFENEFRRLLKNAQPKVSAKLREVLKNWAESDFKKDPELNLIPSLYEKLREEGYEFTNLGEKSSKSASKMAALKDPNVVSSQQEEEDIAKAIELSLKETKSSPKKQVQASAIAGSGSNSTAYPSLYPSFAVTGSSSLTGGANAEDGVNPSNSVHSEPRKVRALYDFEAAEENELTFFAGEIIHVTDDTDPNWWKGYNQRGDGLFPSNFVTADLSVEPQLLDINQQNKLKKLSQSEEDANDVKQKTEAAISAAENQPVEIDESKVDRLLHLLHEANPEDASQDTEEMLRLEREVHRMGPLIDAELERVDRKHAQLTQLSVDLVDAINLYHSLMRDDRAASAAMMGGGGGGGSAAAGAGAGAGGGAYVANTHMAAMPGCMPLVMNYPPATPNAAHMMYNQTGYPGVGNYPSQIPQIAPNYTGANYGNNGAIALANGGASTQHGSNPLAQPSMVATMPGVGYSNGPQLSISAVTTQSAMIPTQFQNGRVESMPVRAAPVMSSSMPAHMFVQQQTQQPQVVTPEHQIPPHSYQIPPQYHHHQQQQRQQQQLEVATSNSAIPPTEMQQIRATTPQPQQFMPTPQQQQQQQQQPPPSSHIFMHPQAQHPHSHHHHHHQQQQQPHQHQHQSAFMVPPSSFLAPGMVASGTTAAAFPSANSSSSSNSNNNNNNNGTNNNNNNNPIRNGNEFTQLQQQMAAMSVASSGGINVSATPSFMVENEVRSNIPIYQQQR